MSNPAKNQAVIGVFVVGAVVLIVIGVIIFGSGKLFEKTDKFVLYFQGSVKGLSIGAPVTFRGVKVGSVVDITLKTDPDNLTIRIPVIVEIPKDRIEHTAAASESSKEAIERLVTKGLRAKLDLQSIVTGQLLINLEFLPNEPVSLSGIKHQYAEIPTVSSNYRRFLKKLEELPLAEILNNASSTLEAAKGLLTNPAIPEMIGRLNNASLNIEDLTAALDQRIVPLIDMVKRIVGHADRLVLDVDGQVKPLAGSVEAAADAIAQLSQGAQPTIDKAGQMFGNLAEMTDPNARERVEIRNTLKELSEMARSLRVLADYLERHPEALITGKGGSKRR